MTPRVVHEQDRVPGAIYVGRRQHRLKLPQSPFANPYRIGPDGTRAEVIALYRQRILGSTKLLRALPQLRGRPLACWCRHDGDARTADNACHADVLLELLERHTDEELRAMAEEAGRR